jgi:hypothetical protein
MGICESTPRIIPPLPDDLNLENYKKLNKSLDDLIYIVRIEYNASYMNALYKILDEFNKTEYAGYTNEKIDYFQNKCDILKQMILRKQ